MEIKLPTQHTLQDVGKKTQSTPIVSIDIPNAKEVIKAYAPYFLRPNQNFVWLPEYDEVAEWLEHNQDPRTKQRFGLVLLGTQGRGKSLMCRQILPAIINTYTNKVVNCFKACPDFQERYTTKQGTAEDNPLLGKFISIDDIGTESTIPYTDKYLFSNVVDLACDRGALLLITTNLSMDEIEQIYGKRTLSRLLGSCRFIFCGGEGAEDYRLIDTHSVKG